MDVPVLVPQVVQGDGLPGLDEVSQLAQVSQLGPGQLIRYGRRTRYGRRRPGLSARVYLDGQAEERDQLCPHPAPVHHVGGPASQADLARQPVEALRVRKP